MKQKKLRGVLLVLLAAVFAASAAMALRQRMQERKIAADNAEAARTAGIPDASHPAPSRPAAGLPEPQETPAEEPQAPPLPEEAAALAEVDLEALRAVNGDVAGWIEIPGTELSYPLMQGTDNQFYLDHNWKGEPSGGGSVFLECTSSRDLSGFHTIAYGHRMKDGSMFGSIRDYAKPEYWREHPSVYVVTDRGVARYDVFSARTAGVRSLVYRLDLEESGLEEELIRSCAEESVIDTGIVPEAGDRILTLSTCTGNGYAARWVVHAVLAEEYRE